MQPISRRTRSKAIAEKPDENMELVPPNSTPISTINPKHQHSNPTPQNVEILDFQTVSSTSNSIDSIQPTENSIYTPILNESEPKESNNSNESNFATKSSISNISFQKNQKKSIADVTPYLTAASAGSKNKLAPKLNFTNPPSFNLKLDEQGNEGIKSTHDLKLYPFSADITPHTIVEELNDFVSSQLDPSQFSYGSEYSRVPFNFSLKKDISIDQKGKSFHLLNLIEREPVQPTVVSKLLTHMSQWSFSNFLVKTFNPEGFTKLASFQLQIPKSFSFLQQKIVNQVFVNLGKIILEHSDFKEDSNSVFFEDDIYSHFVLIDLTSKQAPKKHAYIRHAGQSIHINVTLNSYLRHCTYCNSTEHARRKCPNASACHFCHLTDHPSSRCPSAKTVSTKPATAPVPIAFPTISKENSQTNTFTVDSVSIASNWADEPSDFFTPDQTTPPSTAPPLVSKHATADAEAPSQPSGQEDFNNMDVDHYNEENSYSPHMDDSDDSIEMDYEDKYIDPPENYEFSQQSALISNPSQDTAADTFQQHQL